MLLDNSVAPGDDALMTGPMFSSPSEPAEAGRRPAVARRTGKAAGVALWRQVADHLERAIAAGQYGAGARLPAETEIAALFGVNRHTRCAVRSPP
jgi:Bacterial regulatory proteins, gntR family